MSLPVGWRGGGSVDADAVIAVQDGAGAVARAVKDKLRDVVHAKDFGAALDGVTDDVAAFESAVAELKVRGGGALVFNGIAALSRGLLVDGDAIQIHGATAVYGTANSGTGFRALPGFTGNFILKFARVGANIRACGVRNIGIHGGSASSAHGLVVTRGYDAADFYNINVTGIGDGYNCFLFDAPLGAVGQTIFGANLFGIHRNVTNAAPAFKLLRQQEFTFINCKGWSGSQTSDFEDNTGDAWEIESCNGGTLVSCASVSTRGFGVRLIAGDRGLNGISLLTHTFESVCAPLEIKSDAVKMFGTMSDTVPLGTVVQQPSDGSTATGTAYLSTLSGVYAFGITGEFAAGPLYDADGNAIGTVTTLGRVVPEGIRVTNPRIMGQLASIGAQTSYIRDGKNIEVDWDIVGDATTSFPLDVARGVQGTVRAGSLQEVTNHAVLTANVLRPHVAQHITTTSYHAEYGVGTIIAPKPSRGARMTITHDIVSTTWAQATINLGTGVTILRDGASVSGPLRINGTGSSVELIGLSTTQWAIATVTGAVSLDSVGLITEGVNSSYAATSASKSLGVQHRGQTWTNVGRGASSTTFNLVSALASLVGLEISFCRVDSGPLRLQPNGTDEILGGTGSGKYVEIADSGSLTVRMTAAGKWSIVRAYGAPTWEV